MPLARWGTIMFDWLYRLPSRVIAATVIVAAVVGVGGFAFELPHRLPALVIAPIVLVVTVVVAAGGFELARRFLRPHIKRHDGFNDAISGALGAIGVFYGITVGLIAIDTWQRHSNAQDIVAREAAAIETLYLMVSANIGPPTPVAIPRAQGDRCPTNAEEPLPMLVSEYLQTVVCGVWPEQRKGIRPKDDWCKLRDIRRAILAIDPSDEGQKVRYAATFQSLNHLTEMRRLRVDAANDRLSWVMWTIIILGALMSMCVAYLFKLDNAKLHFLVVCLLSSFLGLILLMILINDRPFLDAAGIDSDSYEAVKWIMVTANKKSESTGADADAPTHESAKKGQGIDSRRICDNYRDNVKR